MKRILGFCVFALLIAPATSTADLQPREIRTLVSEYCNPDTENERRNEIADELQGASSSSHAFSALRRALRDDESRILAIELTGRIRHEQAWRLLSRYLGDEDIAADAASALFAAATDEALRELANRWMNEDPESDLAMVLVEGFRSAPLSIDVLDVLVDALDDEPRSADARDILISQLGLASSANEDEIREAASEHRERVRALATSFSLRGRDLADDVEPNHGAERHGSNYLLENTTLRFEGLDDVEQLPHTIRLRFNLFDAGDETVFSYNFGEGSWWAEIEDGEAVVVDGVGVRSTAQLKQGWNEIEWVVTVVNVGDVVERRLDMRVNGRSLVARGTTNGELDSVTVETDGVIAVGGWELIR